MPPPPLERMLEMDRIREEDAGGDPRWVIIEHWMAWCLVEEREREIARRQRVKEAERSRARATTVTPLTTRAKGSRTGPPEERKAA